MKKIFLILIMITLSMLFSVSCASIETQETHQYSQIPRDMLDFIRTEQYKEQNPIESGHFIMKQEAGLHYYGNFDLDNDGDRDIGILYHNDNFDQPHAYAFDLDDNNMFELEHMWIDDDYDGLNGNEIRADVWFKQRAQSKTSI